MGKWKNIILGEKMPDKDDPKYREKYEKDVEAGRKFARATRIDRLAGHDPVQIMLSAKFRGDTHHHAPVQDCAEFRIAVVTDELLNFG